MQDSVFSPAIRRVPKSDGGRGQRSPRSSTKTPASTRGPSPSPSASQVPSGASSLQGDTEASDAAAALGLDDPAPAASVIAYILLLGVALTALAVPTYVLSQRSVPDSVLPLPTYGTRAHAEQPTMGVDFLPGALHGEGRTLGDERNPRFLVEFTDFFCNHCHEAHHGFVEPLLRRAVPRGLLRVESHPLAVLDDDSLRAAHAALCAQEQGKYWEVRHLLFQTNVTAEQTRAEQGIEGATIFTGALLAEIAKRARLDMSAFVQCFRSERHAQEIRDLTEAARNLGIEETPSFIVGDPRTGSFSVEIGNVGMHRVMELLRLDDGDLEGEAGAAPGAQEDWEAREEARRRRLREREASRDREAYDAHRSVHDQYEGVYRRTMEAHRRWIDKRLGRTRSAHEGEL